ncbi:hypothetical protein [Jiulongibacter sp. NS-SX5]|uniref:hypothetical protein n=1 Tax=Jiulongibacter sp. NS-SX5 TaxID=3463854 RepID=UPI0040594877
MASILEGLIIINPAKTEEIIESLGKEENRQPLLIQTIRRLEDPTYIFKFMKIIRNFSDSVENKLRRLGTFVKLTEVAANSDLNDLIQEIKTLTAIQEERIVSVFFNSVISLKTNDFKQVLEILRNVISNQGFTKAYVIRNKNGSIPLNWLIQDLIKSKEELLLFLKMYAEESPFPFDTSVIDRSINLFLEEPKWIISRILELLIADYGMFRHLGFKLLDCLIDKNIEVLFEEDEISKLSENQQLKLLISLHTPFSQSRIKVFCSGIYLFQTDYQSVAVAFSTILLNKFQNYSHFIEIIERVTIDDNLKKGIIEYLKEKQDYHQSIERKKRKLKEFDSTWKYWKYTELANRLFRQNISDEIEKSSSTGIMGLFQKKVLLKGGGWRMEGETEIRYLNHFQTTSTFSNDLFINPEKESYKSYTFFYQNWDKENWKIWLTRF